MEQEFLIQVEDVPMIGDVTNVHMIQIMMS